MPRVIEDPTTIPGDGPIIEEESTMVDPPNFQDDSVTMVRRDPISRRDRS